MLGREYDAEVEALVRQAVEACLRGHASNPRAKQILDRAFGGPWWQEVIANTPDDQRQRRFTELYEDVLRRAGATHILRFSVDTKTGRHKYFLLHASQSKRAFAAMKDAMFRAKPVPVHGGDDQVRFLPADTTPDVEATVVALAAHFRGRTVRWWSKDYREETVQRFAIEETPLMYDERAALQAALGRRGWTVKAASGKPARPLRFAFPP
jgi:hypothetical protein